MSKLWARGVIAARVVAAVSLASAGIVAVPAPAYAHNYVAISGSGSTWAAIAIDEWDQAVRRNGIVVNYSPDGSAAGRSEYISNQDDFAGSDPPFRNGQDQLGDTGAEYPEGYSYIPDTAGGTAFMYHIEDNGHLIRNLRLTPQLIFDIFTGKITNWDNPAIRKVYGGSLPNLPITPVVRSDGAGETYFLTRYFATEYTSGWNAFCHRVHPGIHDPCGQTEFYPQFGSAKEENGSNNVVAYITSTYGNGSIGYVEYAYALNSHYPVVQVLNPAHYFVGPTASNVAVALSKAVINENPASPNFLQQNLTPLYTLKDPRNYPFSSYSYLIVPRQGEKEPQNFTNAKGYTLSTWVNYLLCAGQANLDQIGYSPLPENLVKGGLIQNAKIPGNNSLRFNQLTNCRNPTMNHGRNILLSTAPYPTACQKSSAPLHCKLVNGKPVATGASSGSKNPKANPSASAATAGATTAAGTGTGPGTTTATGPVTGTVVNLAADHTNEATLGALTATGILVAVAIPPLLAAWLRRRRGQAHG